MTRLIVEADGGSRGNPGPAAYGALVRDADTGDVLAEAGETIGVATNNVAEYQGLVVGLQMARAIDPNAEVEARLDSKLVVEQMSGRWKIKHAGLRPLALEAQRIFPPGSVTYTWVPRERNAHADRLLNEALDGKPTPVPDLDAATDVRDAAGDLPADDVDGDAVGADLSSGEGRRPRAGLVAWSPDVGPPTTLILVRHGQTPMTAAREFSGGDTEGPPLDDVGTAQAEGAGKLLAGWELLAETTPLLVSSPMVRTRQTAEIVGNHLGITEITVDEAWRECEFGEWDGRTLAELTERYPDEVAEYFSSPSFAVPGGESLEAMSRRVERARDEIVRRHGGRTVVVVTHSMVIRALVSMALEAPLTSIFRLQPLPGSIAALQQYADGGTALVGFNIRP